MTESFKSGGPLPPGRTLVHNDTEQPERVLHLNAVPVDIPAAPFLQSLTRVATEVGKIWREQIEQWRKAYAAMVRFGLIDFRPARQRYSAPRPLRAGGGAEYTRRRRHR